MIFFTYIYFYHTHTAVFVGDANGDKMADLYCRDSDYVTKVAISTVKGKKINFSLNPRQTKLHRFLS